MTRIVEKFGEVLERKNLITLFKRIMEVNETITHDI